jgi:hypothetical protein
MTNYVSWDDDKTAFCVCEAGYSGLDCSQRMCPMGDDPITRSGVNEIQSFGVAGDDMKLLLSQYGAKREVSSAGTAAAVSTAAVFGHPMFSLEFEDEMGDKWVTHPIEFTTGNQAPFYDPVAHQMRQPVEVDSGTVSGGVDADGLVVTGSAQAYYHATNPGAAVSEAYDNYYLTTLLEEETGNDYALFTARVPQSGFTWSATAPSWTWTTNPWDSQAKSTTTLPGADIVVSASSVVNSGTMDPVYFITTEDYTQDYSLAKRVESALEALPNNVIENVEVSVEYGVGLTPAQTAADDYGALTVRVTFLENSGNIPTMGVRYCWAYGDAETDVQCNHPDGSFADASGNTKDPLGNEVTAKLTITETVAGSKDNAECSNRGLCDYSTGLCKCFTGYTDFDCSIQNSLASA